VIMEAVANTIVEAVRNMKKSLMESQETAKEMMMMMNGKMMAMVTKVRKNKSKRSVRRSL